MMTMHNKIVSKKMMSSKQSWSLKPLHLFDNIGRFIWQDKVLLLINQNRASRVTRRDMEALMPNMQQNMCRGFYNESLCENEFEGRGVRGRQVCKSKQQLDQLWNWFWLQIELLDRSNRTKLVNTKSMRAVQSHSWYKTS